MVASDLNSTILQNASFVNADLTDADLSNADLFEGNLEGSILSGATLSDADLTNGILTSADLSNTDMTATNLEGVILEQAILDGADFSGSVGLSDEMVDSVASAEGTRYDSLEQIVSTMSTLCKSEPEGIEAAGDYSSSTSDLHSTVLIPPESALDDFAVELPVEWEPLGIRNTELVVCVAPEVITFVDSCIYFSSFTFQIFQLKRYSREQVFWVVDASSGETLDSRKFTGRLDSCGDSESFSRQTYTRYADPIETRVVVDWLTDLVIP